THGLARHRPNLPVYLTGSYVRLRKSPKIDSSHSFSQSQSTFPNPRCSYLRIELVAETSPMKQYLPKRLKRWINSLFSRTARASSNPPIFSNWSFQQIITPELPGCSDQRCRKFLAA